MKWRKKPVVIEAVQWKATQKTWEEISNLGCPTKPGEIGSESFLIPTLEGDMKCSKNDYVIKGVNGEFNPCKPDIFQKTYEPADESPSLSSAEEAAGFAEWCEENYCRHMSSNWIENKNAMNVAIKNSDLFSTSDLYNLYQQSKK